MLATTLLLASAALIAAQRSSTDEYEPCATIADLVADGVTDLPAKDAYDCLRSVPVNVEGDERLIEDLKIVWQWQSDGSWFKNAPDDWQNGKFDIMAELNDIKKNLDSFESEYDVQLAIQNLTILTGNYHMNYAPDILSIFSWNRGGARLGLASVSEDGKALPKLYFYTDVLLLSRNGTGVSEIVNINGEDAYDYLVKLGHWEQYIDSDGRLNSMFWKGDTTTWGGFVQPTQYDGPFTNITFANGTELNINNYATTDLNWSDVVDGESFFEAFCTGNVTGVEALEQSARKRSIKSSGSLPHGTHQPRIPSPDALPLSKRTIPYSLYPDSVAQDKFGAIAGYFLEDEDFADVAVLKIITFSSPNNSVTVEFEADFQATLSKFLEQCRKQEKQKLVVDLRENGGGSTGLLLDSFMQLFPGMEPFSAQRYPATEQFLAIGDSVDEMRELMHRNETLNNLEFDDMMLGNANEYRYWAWWHFRNAQGENFDGWDEFNGPIILNGDNYTALMRYNYSNSEEELVSIRSSDEFNFTDTSKISAPFKASDVVMYTDALCGSACASFFEEMKNLAGVKTVTVGGRPQEAPIQAVTGTKGGETANLYDLADYATMILNISTYVGGFSSLRDGRDDVLKRLANIPELLTRAGNDGSRIQVQDQIRKGDTEAMPLQLRYEAADCRVFYTPTSWTNPVEAWKQAWSAYVDDALCVEGSTGHESSISGGFKPYGPEVVRAEDIPESGGNGSRSGTGSSNGGNEGNGAGSGTGGGGDNVEGAAAGLRAWDTATSMAVASCMLAAFVGLH